MSDIRKQKTGTVAITTRGVDAKALLALLRDLPASGVGSFETLVRDLLSRTTGRRFLIAKSGPQGGIDTQTEADRDAIVIGVETKRYGAATALPLDETKSKLRDAAAEQDAPDLWILVASREIKKQDSKSLVAIGHDLGVEVLILDWPNSAEILPGLLLLCAAHQDVLGPYGLETPAVLSLLDAIRSHARYQAQLDRLIARLAEPELGYGNARRAMSERIRANMASMPAASARIGRYTNLADPSIMRINRPEVRRAISSWWDNPGDRPALALLGPEGMGKTWAALSWWLDRELANNPLPLTLIVPAKYVADPSPDAVIGKALFDIFQTRDIAWWAKRARRWCAQADETRLIIIVDGLNERFEAKDWSLLLAELALGPWKKAVATIITDRTDHWRLAGAGIAGSGVSCAEQAIGAFNTSELDEILDLAGLKLGELDERLIRLLVVPRLCALALRHWDRLGRSGDITPERLIYEDFRDRIYPDLLDDDMRNLIASIGEQIRNSQTPDITVLRRDIRRALSEESGAQVPDATVSEIASGIWFAPIPGEPNRLKLNEDLAPVAIGLALARAVQTCTTGAEVHSRIEAFVDDLRGLELGVTIIGIAASFATVWPLSTKIAREALLDTWLGSDNFARDELKRYARVVQEAPDFFIDRTEGVWRDRQRLHDDRNVHLAGLVHAAEAYPAVMAAFATRATIWLGETFGWRDAMNEGDVPEPIAAPAVRARVAAWNAGRGALPALTMIEPANGEDWVSVAGSVLSAISYLPRAPFAPALGAYAVAMSLTRRIHYHADQFEWLLRANRIDRQVSERLLVQTAADLAMVNHPDAMAARDLLLEALSSLDPAAQPSKRPVPVRSYRFGDAVTDDAGLLHWKADTRKRDAGWGERALRSVFPLVDAAHDPESRLAPASLALLRAAIEDVLGHDEDRSFYLQDGQRVVLARWAPDLLARYFSTTEGLSTAGRGLTTLMKRLEASWLVHDEKTRQNIRIAYQAALRGARDAGTRMPLDLIVMALCDRTVAEQYDAFQAMPGGPTWPKDIDVLLQKPGPAQFALFPTLLAPDQDPRTLTAWLGLLLHSDKTAMPKTFAPVAALFTHPSADVRAAAFQVAANAHDHGLANALRDSGWSAANCEGEEAFQGSIALADAEPVAGDNRPARILSITLGHLSRTWEEEASYAEAFSDNIRDRVERELARTGGSHGFGYAMRDQPSYERLVAERGDDAEGWLEPALGGAPIQFSHMMFSADRASLELTRALIDAGRETGAEIWRALVTSMEASHSRPGQMTLMPFDTRLNPVSDRLRREAFEAVDLDAVLHDIATVLQQRDQARWLISFLEELLQDELFSIARALVLAGDLEDGPDADRLWEEVILPRYLPPWLDAVRMTAHRRYRMTHYAKTWLSRFCSAADPIEAFGAFELFILTTTRACTRWVNDFMKGASERLSPRADIHWLINLPQANARLKEADKDGKDQLAYTKVPKSEQAPWR